MSITSLSRRALVASGLARLALPARAQTAPAKLKMVLNWKYEGPQGWFFLAEDRGYFREEGIEIAFDQRNGSAAGVPLAANGSYDLAFGDINALTELAAKRTDNVPVAVACLYNRPPFALRHERSFHRHGWPRRRRPGPLAKAIDIVVTASGLPRTPGAAEIFNPAFLPPLADRPVKLP